MAGGGNELISTINGGTKRKYAYVTFLAGNGDYVKGVVGLAKGLRKVKTEWPLVVAVLPDVPKEHRSQLVEQGCIVRQIEPLFPPTNIGKQQFARPYYSINYSKLRIWEFAEYDKMIYLDGDIQVYQNIDNLFDLQDGYFYAVIDCLCQETGNLCPGKLQWEAEFGTRATLYFNAGMFVFEPNLSTYADLLKTLKTKPTTAFAEQDLLNDYFKDTYQPVPSVYNLLVAMLWRHPEYVDLEKAKVIHYCVAGSKPWKFVEDDENMNRQDMKMLVKKWWEIFNDETLDYNKWITTTGHAAADVVEDGKTMNNQLVLSEVGDVQQNIIKLPSAA
ncbi:galactinol synthase 2-like [Impatiens glandulifera]|uniref:galactinol synthase 2-like n=1 Tax=Impatiens glandulifera TaxID=253017 RepID=UPI001FB0AA5C|nr:galactinol synthase 2-like [Impatiens glandulifera]